MARANKNTHVCSVCGKAYDYCPQCVIVQPDYNAERFCSKEHRDIFAILSKHGCHLATAEETLGALKGFNTEGFVESIQNHIDSLKPKKVEVKAKAKPKAFVDAIKEVEAESSSQE